MRILKVSIIILIFLLIIAVLSSVVQAVDPTPRPTPKPFPTTTPSSGGGGGGSGSYSTPQYEPFTIPLKSSDGTVIGSLEGKNFNSVILHAEKNATIDNSNYTIILDAELSQKPADDLRLDIDILKPDGSGLPMGMYSTMELSMVKISPHCSSGWSVKGETIKLTFDLPGIQDSDPSTIYYIVRYDGSSYHIYNATLKGFNAGVMKFETSPAGESGLFTIVKVNSSTIMPVSTPIPPLMAADSPTTEPPRESPGTLTIGVYDIVAIFGIMVVELVVILYLLYRR
jgi:hypothetical protein